MAKSYPLYLVVRRRRYGSLIKINPSNLKKPGYYKRSGKKISFESMKQNLIFQYLSKKGLELFKNDRKQLKVLHFHHNDLLITERVNNFEKIKIVNFISIQSKI